IVHQNSYRNMDAEELKDTLSANLGERSFEDWIKAFCNRKYNSDFSREMTRSVKVYLEDYKD
ncbi:MAG: nitroreductase, partial [Clostridia bacterium]|nr:nitroreductase [Clostridia bacterium]